MPGHLTRRMGRTAIELMAEEEVLLLKASVVERLLLDRPMGIVKSPDKLQRHALILDH